MGECEARCLTEPSRVSVRVRVRVRVGVRVRVRARVRVRCVTEPSGASESVLMCGPSGACCRNSASNRA